MKITRFGAWITIVCLAFLFPAAVFADTNCDEGSGSLNSAPPRGISPEEIIQKFAAKEAIFKEARNNYTFTQDITVQTLEGNTVDGEYRQVWDITYDDRGTRLENVTFAPRDSLTRIQMTKEDLRGLTPLIYSNVNPYGLMRLNMAERLTIERAEAI